MTGRRMLAIVGAGLCVVSASVVLASAQQQQTYALVLARADGTYGPNLRPATVRCNAPEVIATTPTSRENPACNMRREVNRFSANGQPWNTFVGLLGSHAGRIKIEDRTGLSGLWDFDVTYTPAPMLGHTNPTFSYIDPTGPTIFVAVEQQLGLRLVPIK